MVIRMIKVNNLNKYYNKGKSNEIHVINNTSLTLPDTGLISFLGQSGSGKTTLLNVIGGLDRASGTIEYDGLVVESSNMKKIDAYRREEIGYVFQNYNLLLEESVYENLAIALEMVNIYDKAEQAKRIEYVLKKVGMYKYRKKKASALSGGQQQRVSIARALVKRSKIIIADEPTGNLDHENTINIMNILKNISKNNLVLMVTHNEEIASFYSDYIYLIKDGTVEDGFIPDSNSTIANKGGNTIYLKDLAKEEINTELLSLDYYTDSKPKRLELRVIERNGTFYIEGNQNIKLLSESNIRALDQHYEKISKEDFKNDSFDTSFFSTGSKKRSIFKSFIENIKISYQNIRAKTRKTKVLYASFVIIGILFAISIISFSNFTVIDDNNISVDDKSLTIHSDEYYNYKLIDEAIGEAYSTNKINNISTPLYLNSYIAKRININEERTASLNMLVVNYNDGRHKLIKGTAPINKDDIVISKRLADRIINGMGKYISSYDDLIGSKITYSQAVTGSLTITGINDNKYELGYLNDKKYIELLSYENSSYASGSHIRNYEVESKAGYKIVEGRDLNSSDGDDVCLINKGRGKRPGDTISIYDKGKFTVVGVYESDYASNSEDEPISKIMDTTTTAEHPIYPMEYMDSYKLIMGNMPKANNELLASAYSGYRLGDIVKIGEGNYKVVGIYNSTLENMYGLIAKRDLVTYSLYLKGGSTIYFDLNEGVSSLELKEDLYLDNASNIILRGLREDQMEALIIYGSLAGLLILIIVIFIYFIMRSRMISDIYTIGVYRSLGARKGRIYTRYIFDILILTTLTTVVGYLLTLLGYFTIASGINSIVGVMGLKMSLGLSLIGVLILYLFNLAFGMLPIALLMRERPSEILSKYDI